MVFWYIILYLLLCVIRQIWTRILLKKEELTKNCMNIYFHVQESKHKRDFVITCRAFTGVIVHVHTHTYTYDTQVKFIFILQWLNFVNSIFVIQHDSQLAQVSWFYLVQSCNHILLGGFCTLILECTNIEFFCRKHEFLLKSLT